jgi:hypothetical protein
MALQVATTLQTREFTIADTTADEVQVMSPTGNVVVVSREASVDIYEISSEQEANNIVNIQANPNTHGVAVPIDDDVIHYVMVNHSGTEMTIATISRSLQFPLTSVTIDIPESSYLASSSHTYNALIEDVSFDHATRVLTLLGETTAVYLPHPDDIPDFGVTDEWYTTNFHTYFHFGALATSRVFTRCSPGFLVYESAHVQFIDRDTGNESEVSPIVTLPPGSGGPVGQVTGGLELTQGDFITTDATDIHICTMQSVNVHGSIWQGESPYVLVVVLSIANSTIGFAGVYRFGSNSGWMYSEYNPSINAFQDSIYAFLVPNRMDGNYAELPTVSTTLDEAKTMLTLVIASLDNYDQEDDTATRSVTMYKYDIYDSRTEDGAIGAYKILLNQEENVLAANVIVAPSPELSFTDARATAPLIIFIKYETEAENSVRLVGRVVQPLPSTFITAGTWNKTTLDAVRSYESWDMQVRVPAGESVELLTVSPSRNVLCVTTSAGSYVFSSGDGYVTPTLSRPTQENGYLGTFVALYNDTIGLVYELKSDEDAGRAVFHFYVYNLESQDLFQPIAMIVRGYVLPEDMAYDDATYMALNKQIKDADTYGFNSASHVLTFKNCVSIYVLPDDDWNHRRVYASEKFTDPNEHITTVAHCQYGAIQRRCVHAYDESEQLEEVRTFVEKDGVRWEIANLSSLASTVDLKFISNVARYSYVVPICQASQKPGMGDSFATYGTVADSHKIRVTQGIRISDQNIFVIDNLNDVLHETSFDVIEFYKMLFVVKNDAGAYYHGTAHELWTAVLRQVGGTDTIESDAAFDNDGLAITNAHVYIDDDALSPFVHEFGTADALATSNLNTPASSNYFFGYMPDDANGHVFCSIPNLQERSILSVLDMTLFEVENPDFSTGTSLDISAQEVQDSIVTLNSTDITLDVLYEESLDPASAVQVTIDGIVQYVLIYKVDVALLVGDTGNLTGEVDVTGATDTAVREYYVALYKNHATMDDTLIPVSGVESTFTRESVEVLSHDFVDSPVYVVVSLIDVVDAENDAYDKWIETGYPDFAMDPTLQLLVSAAYDDSGITSPGTITGLNTFTRGSCLRSEALLTHLLGAALLEQAMSTTTWIVCDKDLLQTFRFTGSTGDFVYDESSYDFTRRINFDLSADSAYVEQWTGTNSVEVGEMLRLMDAGELQDKWVSAGFRYDHHAATSGAFTTHLYTVLGKDISSHTTKNRCVTFVVSAANEGAFRAIDQSAFVEHATVTQIQPTTTQLVALGRYLHNRYVHEEKLLHSKSWGYVASEETDAEYVEHHRNARERWTEEASLEYMDATSGASNSSGASSVSTLVIHQF